MQCSYHPKVETNLRCSKCEKPICPRCMVYTPVGPRCPECAAVRRLPTYDVSLTYYARAIGVGLGLAVVAGFVWAFLGGFAFLFSILTALAVGYAIGEVISYSVNRKRGLGLQIIAGLSVFLAFVFRGVIPILVAMPAALADTSLVLSWIGQTLLRTIDSPWNLIFVGIAVFVAVRRL